MASMVATMVATMVAMVLFVSASQAGHSDRVKRAPFDFGRFIKKASEQVAEAAKHIKVEDVKKTWEDVKEHVGDAGHLLMEHADKVKQGEYDDKAKEILHGAGHQAEHVGKQVVEKVQQIDLDRTKDDIGRNWDNIKHGAEELGKNVQKATKVDLATPGKAFVDLLEKSVANAYNENANGIPCDPPPPFENGYFDISSLMAPYTVHYYCHVGYQLSGSKTQECHDREWQGDRPTCERYCAVTSHASVVHTCKSGDEERACAQHEAINTQLITQCNFPNYYTNKTLGIVTCGVRGWSGPLPTCEPVCGLVTPRGMPLVAGGRVALRGEVPWHAGVYRTMPPAPQPLHICGATIITDTVLISAAHCFWSEQDGLIAASEFLVAVGKLFRPWNSPRDAHAQKKEVSTIYVPKRFRGVETNFQDDIAMMVLRSALTYKPHVRPVCLELSARLNNQQLTPGSVGKVAGWGLTSSTGLRSAALRVADMPYVDVLQCLEAAPFSFREYITSDKFCAGHNNGTAVCRGDSGGGLVFADTSEGFPRYFLRGVVSTAPRPDDDDDDADGSHAQCNTKAYTAFTEVVRHAAFVDMHVRT